MRKAKMVEDLRYGYYRYQLLLQSVSRPLLHQVLQQTCAWLQKNKLATKVQWTLDVDPLEVV